MHRHCPFTKVKLVAHVRHIDEVGLIYDISRQPVIFVQPDPKIVSKHKQGDGTFDVDE